MIKTWNTTVRSEGSPVHALAVWSPKTGNMIWINSFGIETLLPSLVHRFQEFNGKFGVLNLTLLDLQDLYRAAQVRERHPGCTANSEETDGECPECDAMMASHCT